MLEKANYIHDKVFEVQGQWALFRWFWSCPNCDILKQSTVAMFTGKDLKKLMSLVFPTSWIDKSNVRSYFKLMKNISYFHGYNLVNQNELKKVDCRFL